MQLMSDALAVTGSRHGIFVEPHKRACALLRFASFPNRPFFHLRAGLRVGSREVIFPLAPLGKAADFNFVDQRTSPCTIGFIGLDSSSGLKVRLNIIVPFKPRDAVFSTAPVFLFDLSVEPIGGQYRWDNSNTPPARAELCLEITDGPFAFKQRGRDSLDLIFKASSQLPGGRPAAQIRQRDRLIVVQGRRVGRGFTQSVRPRQANPPSLRVAWCTWSAPVLCVQGSKVPFLYAEEFPSLDVVSRWAKKESGAIIKNAAKVDAAIGGHNLGPSASHLLAYTLHSWMLNTWWCRRPDGREWFSVWEGNCHFHSTIDVEFTQAPFYLALWPELLGIELDYWPEYAKSGESCLGARGIGTKFLSHDCGAFSEANAQIYPHEMEVEETGNWILMLFAHSRRTGDRSIARKHVRTLEQFLRFLIAADTTGNGVPDHGVANTIDDASPAIQYGKEQTYLAVKTLGALETGAILLRELKDIKTAKLCMAQAKKLRATIQAKGWAHDHFTVLLKKGGRLKNPWGGHEVEWETIPGWNAPHIYTANTLPILDMVGYDLKLDPARVKRDLEVATARCLRQYGCTHTDFTPDEIKALQQTKGLAGASKNPGWIAMNMVRDLAALYRGIDLTVMFERYWEWQVATNTRETNLFFETFCGNNLHFYPRGVVIWGLFDAVNGVAIDRTKKLRRSHPRLPHLHAPRLDLMKW